MEKRANFVENSIEKLAFRFRNQITQVLWKENIFVSKWSAHFLRESHTIIKDVRSMVEKLLESNFIQRKLPRKFANKNIKKNTSSPTPILHLGLVHKSQAKCFS